MSTLILSINNHSTRHLRDLARDHALYAARYRASGALDMAAHMDERAAYYRAEFSAAARRDGETLVRTNREENVIEEFEEHIS